MYADTVKAHNTAEPLYQRRNWITTLNRHPLGVCLTLFGIATAVNLFKPFHIDDTFHLEAAQWIEQHPLRPMSGQVNWYQQKEPLHHANQPPLYFYLVAAVGSVFGYSEVSLHLMQALFSFIAIYFFHQIALLLRVQNAGLLTAFFTFSPAFLVSQNLMVDVPLVALLLVFFYILLTPRIHPDGVRYLLAATTLSIALLIKYSSLPLLVMLPALMLFRKKHAYLPVVLIPIGVLALWAYANVQEYGSVHLFDRPRAPWSFGRLVEMVKMLIIGLGAISPFTLLLYVGLISRQRKPSIRWVSLPLVGIVSLVLATYSQIIPEQLAHHLLYGLFLLNGAAFIGLTLWLGRDVITAAVKGSVPNESPFILLLWMVAMTVFVVLFSPFMATRHILLILPPMMFLAAPLLNRVTSTVAAVSLGFALGLGVVLAVSDWYYADFYRQTARQIRKQLPPDRRVWALGHWGWQWYATQAGMQQYEAGLSPLKTGDFIVVPLGVDRQTLRANVPVRVIKRIVPPPTLLTFFSTGHVARFYAGTSWHLTAAPIDTVVIYEVARRYHAR
ncbi:hypothetical protein BN8_03996 [Fibrisoma limi BUZ 3]|uniref:Glycosyltransferase RgtA/B/C/D-like domain-containing protein n=1 Tax=Fibrisoma limi BUZ 3 TaxID=1185876 RepID=I2GLL5_9BACT|nr:glycosyltransferase family 39 protein [Fibrisoma limi]CCH54791.1 hypothetical protein BN8_03996 [Fibrisoma limi BUZ 3]